MYALPPSESSHPSQRLSSSKFGEMTSLKHTFNQPKSSLEKYISIESHNSVYPGQTFPYHPTNIRPPDSGDYCNLSLSQHFEREMGMTPTCLDPFFYFYYDNSRNIIELTGVYVDDSFYYGPSHFFNHFKITLCKFKSHTSTFNNFRFAAIFVNQEPDGIRFHQNPYLKLLKPLPCHCNFYKLS